MFRLSIEPGTPPGRIPAAYELGHTPGAPGVRPEYVRWIQTSLNRILGLRLPVDGRIGPQTRSALRDFQRRAGLRADAIVGPLTEAALIRLSAEKPAGAASAAASALPPRYFKDSPALRAAPLAAPAPIVVPQGWSAMRRRLARIGNRLGGLMDRLASEAQVSLPGVLAVWSVEGGGLEHVRGRAIIRFENHLLFRSWGRANAPAYDAHFQHGGHAGVAGKAWENHRIRPTGAGPFATLHGDQEREYRALELATRLAGAETAQRCISIGGPQILVSNHRVIGYATPGDMVRAFQDDERWHVLGFFDFCRHQPAPAAGALLAALRAANWAEFARYYNGPGQVQTYSALLAQSFSEARQLAPM